MVSTTGSTKLPGEGGTRHFIALPDQPEVGASYRLRTSGWVILTATSSRPSRGRSAAFLSGNFIDWCQQNRDHWRGTADVLQSGSLPMWASCGGAQGLAILAETGVNQPWDCPQCRDPANPRLPIYTHIAGSVRRKCGDYSGCVFERRRV